MSEQKKAAIISLLAETHIHIGIGQSTGALDLPVARERTTYFPFVPGSGVKGAFRVWADEKAGLEKDVAKLFGPKDEDTGGDLYAGTLLCSDARLLLLPVRCTSEAYKWVTCPTILNRFQRDCSRVGPEIKLSEIKVQETKYLGVAASGNWLGLEEREFECAGAVPADIVEVLKPMLDEDLAQFLDKRLVILSDDDFVWFAKYALPVMTRNVLVEKKISTNLWHEESLPPDTVMYMLFGERKGGAVAQITDAIGERSYIQMGGNETVGQGWFRMTVLKAHKGGQNA